MSKPNTLAVHILDKEYLVACPPDAQTALKEAASQLDSKMREIRQTGKVYGTERIAVMAALNLTYDLMQQSSMSTHMASALEAIGNKIDTELARSDS